MGILFRSLTFDLRNYKWLADSRKLDAETLLLVIADSPLADGTGSVLSIEVDGAGKDESLLLMMSSISLAE